SSAVMLLGSLSSSAFTFSSSYLSPAYFPGPSRSIPSTSLAACFTSSLSDSTESGLSAAFFSEESREQPLLNSKQRINIHENAFFIRNLPVNIHIHPKPVTEDYNRRSFVVNRAL